MDWGSQMGLRVCAVGTLFRYFFELASFKVPWLVFGYLWGSILASKTFLFGTRIFKALADYRKKGRRKNSSFLGPERNDALGHLD